MRGTLFGLILLLLAAGVSPAEAANGHQGRPDFQLTFDLSRAPVDLGDGRTLFWEMTMDGEAAGYVIVGGLGIDGRQCQHLHYQEAWEYHIDRPLPDGSREVGTLIVEKSSGPLSLCNGDWLSLLDGYVDAADGDYAGLEGGWIRMEATFTSETSECICSFSL